jgi:hypothetical protein
MNNEAGEIGVGALAAFTLIRAAFALKSRTIAADKTYGGGILIMKRAYAANAGDGSKRTHP